MAYALRLRECCVCGVEMLGHYPPTKPVRCIKCALDVSNQNAREMHAKSGPAWDRWKAAMRQAMMRDGVL